MLSVQHLIATSHEGFPAPQEGVLHPAVALGCSCCRDMWLFGFCLLHADLPHFALVPMHPHHSCNTTHGTDSCSRTKQCHMQ